MMYGNEADSLVASSMVAIASEMTMCDDKVTNTQSNSTIANYRWFCLVDLHW